MGIASDLTDYEVADRLRKHPRTIQRWCLAGKLPGAYKAGRSWRIPESAVRCAQLGKALEEDSTERELRAATLACQALAEELKDLGRRGGPKRVRDWPKLAYELKQLQAALRDLPERASKVSGYF